MARPGTTASREVVLSFANKRKNQRKLPLFRRSGPATKGLHAPWIPKVEVAEGAGYANAVLLFALNARALCSVSKFGSSLEPPLFLTAAIISGGSPQKAPHQGSWPSLRGLKGLDGLCVTARQLQRGGLPPSLAPLVRNPFTAVRRGRACPARDFAMPPVNGQPPPTARGAGCRPPLPLSSATHLWHPVGAGHARPSTLPLPPMYLLLRREGS